MNKLTLKKLVAKQYSTRQIATELGCSQTNVKYWLKKHGLKTVYKKHNTRLGPHTCSKCGEDDGGKFYKNAKGKVDGYCKECFKKYWREKARERKKRAVDYKGGECEICGYCKCIASLEFHHTDPKQKDPNFKTARNWKWERMKKELEKCVLVCRNCHGELHYDEDFE